MSELRQNRRKDRNKDPKGRDFMLWVKRNPCCVCARGWHSPTSRLVEFAHIGGGIAAKASNMSGIPLCMHHHRISKFSQENLKGKFGDYYGFDVAAEIAALVAEFESAPKG